MSCCSCKSSSNKYNKSHKSCICFRIPNPSNHHSPHHNCFSQLIFNSGCPPTPFAQTLTVASPPCSVLPILPSSSTQLSVAPCSRPSTFTLVPVSFPVVSVTLQSSGLIVPPGCSGCYAVDISVSLSVTITGTGVGPSSIVAVSLCSTMMPNSGMVQTSFTNICGEASYTFAAVGTQGPVINISATGIVNLVDGQIVTPCVQFKGVTLPVGSVINTYCTSVRLNRIGKPIN